MIFKFHGRRKVDGLTESVLFFLVASMKICELLMMSLWTESGKQPAVQLAEHLQRSKNWRRTSRLLFSRRPPSNKRLNLGVSRCICCCYATFHYHLPVFRSAGDP